MKVYEGDCLTVLKSMPGGSVNCCVTSPPYYGLRDYGVAGQIGLEQSPDEYVAKLVEVFREVKRVLKDDGTLWLNLGDSYAGSGNGSSDYREDGASISKNDNKYGNHKPLSNVPAKNLLGIPWRVAFALQADGWYLRSDIIWHKPNPMPESVKDRPTKAHEYIFLLAKSEKYFYDYEAILEAANYDGRKDTIFKGSLKYDDETLARVSGERWPNKIRDYKTKDGGNGQSPQHRGADITGHKSEQQYGVARAGDAAYTLNDIPARNKRSVWTVNTKPFKEAHFAVFPPNLIKPCILAGCPRDGIVLDPFTGSGTTGVVCAKYGRDFIGIELNPEYVKMAERRINQAAAQGVLPL